jgi:hypothetical protein
MAAASSVRRTACARATKSAATVGKTAKAKSKSASEKSTATKRTKADSTRKVATAVEAVPASDELTASPTATKTARALGGAMAEGGSLSADETSRRAAAGSAKGSRSAQSTSPCPAAGSRNASRRTQTKTAPTKKTLVQRVYNTIDGELTKLEKQKGLTSQDRERASRALSQMVSALEKAVEMQREMTKTKTSGGGAKSRESLAHAEDLRREIAERLERLNRKRAAPRSSE